MIEWWQAVLISLPSAILGGLAVGITALVVQGRQLSHNASMQARRLDHDRALKRDEALRERRVDRLQPVIDGLAQLEASLGAGMVRSLAMEQDEPEAAEEMERIVEAEASSSRFEASVRLIGLAFTIRDAQVSDDLTDVASHMMTIHEDASRKWLVENLADIHLRLDAYAIELDEADTIGGGQPTP